MNVNRMRTILISRPPFNVSRDEFPETKYPSDSFKTPTRKQERGLADAP